MDFGEELGAGEVAAVKGFGTNGYGVDLVGILGGVLDDGGGVVVVGGVVFVVCYPDFIINR